MIWEIIVILSNWSLVWEGFYYEGLRYEVLLCLPCGLVVMVTKLVCVIV